ncbi:MAG: T9SS type A sorting domain-containing protein [Flavobacteriales bacterium]|nr:T9SS type A sorting domain-containing protein [Flavobacteriales bacterium]MCC6938383.1 T9SS type A sorting domain-containing protein [Flavobacteriales bacterium]
MNNRYPLLCFALLTVATIAAQPGTLDPSFGTNGKAIANVPGTYCSGQAIAEQADGKLLVCGQTPGSTLLVRFNADGSLDGTFGSNGLVLTDVDVSNDYIGSIAVQPDGKIVVGGNKFDALANADVIVMRYLPDGTLDASFSGDGIADFSIGTWATYATGLVVQPDGRIVICGDRYVGPGWESFLTRFNTNGSWDSGFGTVQLDMAATSSDNLHDIALQPDGKILVCGTSLDASDNHVAIARYNADGTIDTGFGTGGKLMLSPGGSGDDRANSLRVQPDGRILVTGISGDGNDFGIGVLRLMPDGTNDASFGTGGFALIPFGADDWTQPSLALQSDGRIVIGADNTSASTPDVKVIRLNADGTLDSGFGTNGIGTSNATSGNNAESAVRTLFLQDGGIVVAGYAEASNPSLQLAVWKFLSGVNVGLAEQARRPDQLALAPNPAQDRLVIRGAHIQRGGSIAVHDQSGRQLTVPTVINTDHALVDVSALAPGSYTITVRYEDSIMTQRFIKE